MERERKLKERGAKLYQLFLHCRTILSLYLLYYFNFIDKSPVWVLMALLSVSSILKLHKIRRLTIEAYKQNLTLTEYIDEIKKSKRKN